MPTPYTLVFNYAQLQAIGANPEGDYALATDIDASGYSGFTPIGASRSPAFSGTFNGLGGDIENLTISTSGPYAGLFGYVARSGNISNVGLVGGTVTDTASGADVGGLAGYNNGSISEAFASSKIVGGDGSFVGGLVGINIGQINLDFAAGAVSAGSNAYVGGLAGENYGVIADAYAVGTASGGSGSYVGGLVGFNTSSITDTYATGAVSGGTTGGLVARTAEGATTDSYWDTLTTGQSTSAGGVGETTTQLQAALPTFANPGNWGIVAGKSYPYLCFEFAGCTAKPQVVAGTFYTDQGFTAAGSGIAVQAVVSGADANSAQTGGAVATGANGYYYDLLAPGTIPTGGAVLAYSASSPIGAALTDQVSSGYVSNADIFANTLHIVTPAALYSTAKSDLSTTIGDNAAASALVGSLPNLTIDASNAFTIDAAISGYSGTVIVSTPDNLTISAGGSVTRGSIVLETLGAFINQAGAGALSATAAKGAWLVYSTNPNLDTYDGLPFDFFQYGATYTIGQDGGTTPIGSGNGGLYSYSPSPLTITGVTRAYNGTTALPTVGADYTTAGANSGDTVTLNASAASGAFASSNVGSGVYVTATTLPTAVVTRDGAPVYGYTVNPVVDDPIGTITAAALTYSVADANSIYGTTATLGATTLYGVVPGDTVIPTVQAFAAGAPVTLSPFTPLGQYAEKVTALSNPNYSLAAAGNVDGVLTIAAVAAVGLAPSQYPPSASPPDSGGAVELWPFAGPSCSGGPKLPAPGKFSDPVDAVEAISQSMSDFVEQCKGLSQTTLADALDKYAAELALVAPRLPPALRNLPALVSRAAQRVRAAPNRAAAAAVLRETVAVIHKEIALLRSENPNALSAQSRGADAVATTLNAASAALLRSEEL